MDGLVMKYFVLNPTKRGIYGKASRFAIREYAQMIRHENSKLCEDLLKWIADIEHKMIEEDTMWQHQH